MSSLPMVGMEMRRAELLDDIVAETDVLLAEFGLSDDVRRHIGHAMADHFAERWGGQVISFPKDHHYRLSQRERIILAEHRQGATLAQLSLKYRMGERGLRRLLKRAELRDPDRDQHTFAF